MSFNLDGRRFSPMKNSDAGRLASDAVFTFGQSGKNFTAVYSGAGFSDGHLIGTMTGKTSANLIYHCRADTGELEAGEASASFELKDGRITISMTWQWLNGSKKSGTSYYEEIK